jgi:hypothetical protein
MLTNVFTGSQSVVKNDILYIDSGVQKWNGTDIAKPILGINSYMITIPLNFTCKQCS